MTFDNSYRFLLEGIEVYPLVGNELNFNYSRFDDSYSFRKELTTSIKFTGNDYDTIELADIDFKFSLVLQKYNGTDWIDDYTSYFYKTDCEFNKDDKIVEVKTIPDDGYEDVKNILNNKYNIIDFELLANNVTYKAMPILQVMVVKGSTLGWTKIYNICGVVNWEEEIGRSDKTPANFINDLKNVYHFEEITPALPPSPEYTNVFFYQRYLTNLSTFNGVATLVRPENDISQIAINTFDRISKEIVTGLQIVSNEVQDDPSIYGLVRTSSHCSANEGKYYKQYDSGIIDEIVIPVNPVNWGCESNWLIKSSGVNEYEHTNSANLTLKDAYKISDLIQAFLNQESDILFDETTDYSEFLFSSNNPVSGDSFNVFVTPKSNIKNLFYSEPAQKADLRLKELLDFLLFSYNLSWHIEIVGNEKRFRLEHVSWYENGGTYLNQSVELDLTLSIDPRTQLPLSYYQNKYNYNKVSMPSRIEFKWMDDSSPVFNGSPIEIINNQVEKGNVKQNYIGLFTTDLDLIYSSENVSLNGFVGLATDNLNQVLREQIYVTDTAQFYVQNALLALKDLLPKYWRYGLPSEDILINEEQTTALSIKRNKQQEVEFVIFGQDIDLLKLIKTELGSGQVDSMTLNLINFKYKIVINHDTE